MKDDGYMYISINIDDIFGAEEKILQKWHLFMLSLYWIVQTFKKKQYGNKDVKIRDILPKTCNRFNVFFT